MKATNLNVVITGPESCGKSTLAASLCKYFDQEYEDEFARSYLKHILVQYHFDDIIQIAKGQNGIQQSRSNEISPIIIHDTDLLTLKIWSEIKFNKCDPWIIQQWVNSLPDLYILCDYHIPWSADSLRENPDDRDVLFEIYQKQIMASGADFIIVKGNHLERFEQATDAIQSRMDTYTICDL